VVLDGGGEKVLKVALVDVAIRGGRTGSSKPPDGGLLESEEIAGVHPHFIRLEEAVVVGFLSSSVVVLLPAE
jgi:hypothetical protein